MQIQPSRSLLCQQSENTQTDETVKDMQEKEKQIKKFNTIIKELHENLNQHIDTRMEVDKEFDASKMLKIKCEQITKENKELKETKPSKMKHMQSKHKL